MAQENAHLLKQLEGGANESAEVSHVVFAFLVALICGQVVFTAAGEQATIFNKTKCRSRFVRV